MTPEPFICIAKSRMGEVQFRQVLQMLVYLGHEEAKITPATTLTNGVQYGLMRAVAGQISRLLEHRYGYVIDADKLMLALLLTRVAPDLPKRVEELCALARTFSKEKAA